MTPGRCGGADNVTIATTSNKFSLTVAFLLKKKILADFFWRMLTSPALHYNTPK